MRQDLTRCFIEAAHLLESADSLIIAAGAGNRIVRHTLP